jgi:pyridoxamine 5'-phosphate oxidase
MNANEWIAQALDLLTRANADKNSPLRWPVLASVNIHEGPEARMVVMRRFDREARQIFIYSDARSGKMHDIAANPQVELVFFSRPHMLQIRARGEARAHMGDEMAANHWQQVGEAARRDYVSAAAPGTALDAPAIQTQSQSHFAVLVITLTRLDVLSLKGETQSRVIAQAQGEGWLAALVRP